MVIRDLERKQQERGRELMDEECWLLPPDIQWLPQPSWLRCHLPSEAFLMTLLQQQSPTPWFMNVLMRSALISRCPHLPPSTSATLSPLFSVWGGGGGWWLARVQVPYGWSPLQKPSGPPNRNLTHSSVRCVMRPWRAPFQYSLFLLWGVF